MSRGTGGLLDKLNVSNENEMGGGPGRMATSETNAYETTARDESRATSNGGSVPRCKLERAVERPTAEIQQPSRKSIDDICDESGPGWRLVSQIERLWRALFGHGSYRMEVKSAGAGMTTVRAMGKRVRVRPGVAISFINKEI